jgi:hypothetical protein
MLNASEELPMELELNEDFKDLLRLFNSNSVRYLLIGDTQSSYTAILA